MDRATAWNEVVEAARAWAGRHNVCDPISERIMEAITLLDQDPPTPSGEWERGADAALIRCAALCSEIARGGGDAKQCASEIAKIREGRAQAPTPSGGEMECADCDMPGGALIAFHQTCYQKRVRAYSELVRATEREANAQIAENYPAVTSIQRDHAYEIARMIRNRTPKEPK